MGVACRYSNNIELVTNMYGNVALTELDIVVPDLLIFIPDH